jgi:hypothetical protein
LTTLLAGGNVRRRLANHPGIGSSVRGGVSFDSCSSMSTYFFSITGHA